MKETARLLRDFPSTAPDAEEVWARSPLSGRSDAELVSAAVEAIAAPKRRAESSFVIHAPLELLARASLLSFVEPTARQSVRRRIAAIASQYAQAGEEIGEAAPLAFADPAAAMRALMAALPAGDSRTADGAISFLAARLHPAALARALAEVVAPHLGAAAHAPILLAEMMRIDGRIEGVGRLLRAPVHAIAKEPQRMTWQTVCEAPAFAGDAARELARRLAAVEPVKSPSTYILPTMLAVEARGFADRALGDATAALPLDDARRGILRVAALSMLQDDAASAPYGWTHALTMPLAVLSLAREARDVRAMIRIAATHLLGFRATLGKVRLDLDRRPEPAAADALHDVAPGGAAGAAYHWPTDDMPRLKRLLATRAAAHRDAHLAKHTLACFDAAAVDPEEASLYYAAAAFLGAWWDANPDAGFE
jgi:hypothetical protein